MASPQFDAHRIAAHIEPVLADALERNNTLDLGHVRDYALLFTEPDLELYRPENIFQSFVMHFPPSSFSIHVDHVETERVGDPERMSACVAALLKAIDRGPNTILAVEIYEEEEHGDMIPRMRIAFNGPGRVRDHFRLLDRFPMSLDELSDCWTLATSGGRIDRLENGLELRLTGMRMPPAPLDSAAEIVASLGRTPDAGGAEAALALLEDQSPPDMLDLERLFTESLEENAQDLNQGGIVHSYSFSEGFPQLPLNRPRMQAFFANLFAWAVDAMPDGGSLECLLEYDAAAREATGLASLSAAQGEVLETFHAAMLKRAIHHHNGTFDLERTGDQAALTFTLPDQVGQTLDDWLPGWQAFGPESRKYLRLLKSGGQAPPEDFILGGVLEQELENWLLPRLREPLTVNLVKEGGLGSDGIRGAIKERLKKALDQVGRGKPKKEICQPQYAGELFAAFRQDMRHRHALGTEVLTDGELQELCEALLDKPVDALACLRLLAPLLARATTYTNNS